MKVGSEPKKVAALVLLLGVAGLLFYQQLSDAPGGPSASASTRTAPAARPLRGSAEDILEASGLPRPRSTQRANTDFRPALKKSKPGQGPDPARLDPTLRIDLLAKVQAVGYEGVDRNLFQFGAARPKLTPQQQAEAAKQQAAAAAPKQPDAPPPAPSKPSAPAINMKYFGYVNRPGDARKRAFLIDGEEIYVAVEGEVIKKRYKIVRIGINSLVVEDIDFQSQQTLPLQEG